MGGSDDNTIQEAVLSRARCPDTKFMRILREFAAEFMGTFLLVGVGDGAVAAFVLFTVFGSASDRDRGFSFFTVNWGYGLALMLGVATAGGISGAHLNPAVTTTMALLGQLSWWRMFHYILAQYLGAFFGAAFVYTLYAPKFYARMDAHVRVTKDNASFASADLPRVKVGEEAKTKFLKGTAGIYATYPNDEVPVAEGFFIELALTALLLFAVLAITDSKNMKIPAYLYPLYIGLLLVAIGVCFGPLSGYAINPARDLGPRVFTAMADWGGMVFDNHHSWFWVPVLAPHLGGLLGGFMYVMIIGNHIPDPEGGKQTVVETVGDADLGTIGGAQPGSGSGGGGGASGTAGGPTVPAGSGTAIKIPKKRPGSAAVVPTPSEKTSAARAAPAPGKGMVLLPDSSTAIPAATHESETSFTHTGGDGRPYTAID